MKKPHEWENKVILVVDDDKYICDFLSTVLNNRGFRAVTAQDGNAALKVVYSGQVDLILLDWMMPVLSGFDVIKRLQEGEFQKIPVIVITARVSDKATIDTLRKEVNVYDFLEKPLDYVALVERVEAILKKISAKSGGKKP